MKGNSTKSAIEQSGNQAIGTLYDVKYSSNLIVNMYLSLHRRWFEALCIFPRKDFDQQMMLHESIVRELTYKCRPDKAKHWNQQEGVWLSVR